MTNEDIAKELAGIFKSITPVVTNIGDGFVIVSQGKAIFIGNSKQEQRKTQGQIR